MESTSVQTRLVLVLDEETELPVWYDIIPGNVLDISTIMTVVNPAPNKRSFTRKTVGRLRFGAGLFGSCKLKIPASL
ncbi:MAG: hypothetical protein IJ795_01100 [Bacteroidales bacterium]|nr:hypothetical protein [Bacteroidales bacterium]